jgi:hypothetical protein
VVEVLQRGPRKNFRLRAWWHATCAGSHVVQQGGWRF